MISWFSSAFPSKKKPEEKGVEDVPEEKDVENKEAGKEETKEMIGILE